MKFLVENISYHIEMCGEGAPLLMLHGFTGRGSNWLPFCSTLGKKSKLIMPDIIGHGLTRFPEKDKYVHDGLIIEREAKHFINIIDQLGYEKVDILGYSMGGRLALCIAVLFPDRVRKLILESASPGIHSAREAYKRQNADMLLGISLLENGIEKFVDDWENLPLFESQKSLPAEVRAALRRKRLMNDPGELGVSLVTMGTGTQPSYWDDLKDISADVLMIVGELDHKFSQIAEDMQKNLQKGEICRIKNAGHAIHVEQPEKFGTIVSEFLKLNT